MFGIVMIIIISGCSQFNPDKHTCDRWSMTACFPDTEENHKEAESRYVKIQECEIDYTNRPYIQGLICEEWSRKSEQERMIDCIDKGHVWNDNIEICIDPS